MGQDIHLVVEESSLYYPDHSEPWRLAAGQPYHDTLFIWRDYSVFNTLVATARGDVDVHIADEPRGLPYDASTQARQLLSSDYGDLHSHSWISGEEFVQHFPWKEKPELMSHFAIVGWSIVSSWQSSTKYRFLFAFDN
jgi:hypothetical protein